MELVVDGDSTSSYKKAYILDPTESTFIWNTDIS